MVVVERAMAGVLLFDRPAVRNRSWMATSTLENRVALITGASGGIGGALALRLAAEGVDLALAYGTHAGEAEAVAGRVRELGRRAILLSGDLADPEVPARLLAETTSGLGSCDVLVANAGTGERLPWADVDLETWDRTVAVNLRAPWLLTQAALPGMLERGFGRILYVSSIAALNGGVVGPHYAASKAGLHGLMHHIAARVAGRGVTVNTIAPALVAGTRMLPADPGNPEAMPMPVPVGRLGTTDEVADLAATMLRLGYLTNKTYPLDGGLVPA
jgi:3-oxoacyl-[acyl-carrier protein] reductase